MPYLSNQVEIINEHLKAKLLNGERFHGAQINGLAKKAITIDLDEDENEIQTEQPVIEDENGNANSVGIDDTYSLVIYHRHENSTFEDVNDSSYGDITAKQQENASMRMIVFGRKQSLRLTDEELISLIILAMPSNASRSMLSGIKIDSLSVSVSSSDMDAQSVFGEEYSGVDFPISQSEFLFKINYSITTQYRKDCFNLCDCDSSKT